MGRTVRWGVLVAAIGYSVVVSADVPCPGFKWPIDAERQLFSSSATAASAGSSKDDANELALGQLYELALTGTEKVELAAAPSKKTLTDGDHAGIARFTIADPGKYRVSLDAAFWVEIVHDGVTVPAHDFSGGEGCSAPRKVVEYELPSAGSYLLQLSGATPGSVRVAITPVASPSPIE